MRLNSLSVRLSLWYAAVCLVVCTALAACTYFWLHDYLITAIGGTLDRRTEQIAALWKLHEDAGDEPNVINEIRVSYAPEQNDRFIRISEVGGKTLYVSGPPADGKFNPRKIPIETTSAAQPPLRRLAAQNMLIASRRVAVNSVSYVIEVGTSLETTQNVLHAFLTFLLLGTPVVLIIAVGGGIILVQKSLRPVQEIAAAAQDITYRNPRSRLPVARTGDELENLSIVLNQMLARLESAFVVSQRFGAMASHELRTPLTIIIGDLEELLRDRNLEAEARVRIASVFEEAERLVKIVEGLFAITRLDAGEARMNSIQFDLSALVETTAEQMGLMAVERGLSLRCDTLPKLEIVADKSRIKQVVVNLLDNAIKYSHEKGQIILRTERAGGEAVLQVVDEGRGISAEALPHVFESFFRAENELIGEIDGAGLGLSIVNSICIAHRGTVDAANRPEGGCIVTVRLPLQKN